MRVRPCDPCKPVSRAETNTMLHERVTGAIIEAFYKVYNTLGYGFLEKVYENALVHDLSKTGLRVEAQKKVEA